MLWNAKEAHLCGAESPDPAAATPSVYWSDGLPVPGWELDQEEPWLVMSWTPRPVSSRAEPVGEAGAADRVLVQRSAFAGSTFTVEREHRDGFALDELEQRTHLARVEPAVPAHAQVAQLDRADGRCTRRSTGWPTRRSHTAVASERTRAHERTTRRGMRSRRGWHLPTVGGAPRQATNGNPRWWATAPCPPPAPRRCGSGSRAGVGSPSSQALLRPGW